MYYTNIYIYILVSNVRCIAFSNVYIRVLPSSTDVFNYKQRVSQRMDIHRRTPSTPSADSNSNREWKRYLGDPFFILTLTNRGLYTDKCIYAYYNVYIVDDIQ